MVEGMALLLDGLIFFSANASPNGLGRKYRLHAALVQLKPERCAQDTEDDFVTNVAR